MNKKYQPVIGLEVHVELKTKSKMFCSCSADYFGKEPNTYTCPVCLGLPGALPVPNKTAIEWCIMIGLALNCIIAELSKFDRKNYFYPDLPKGYQISQYDQPFCINGHMILANGKQVRIRRVHMEEDTGKLIHETDSTFIDFNRSGVPLVEIVTEPDFGSPEEVVEYLKKLQQIVRYLNVSDADMEKGGMRLEPNISLKTVVPANEARPESEGDAGQAGMTDELPDYKVEVKNINSFRFVGRAIKFEAERQSKILEKRGIPLQETRGWNEAKGETVSQRSKEEAHDYRYFPEPDIPPFVFSRSEIERIKMKIPELPDVKTKRFLSQYRLNVQYAEILTELRERGDFFERAVTAGKAFGLEPKDVANYLVNKDVDTETLTPTELVNRILTGKRTETIHADELEQAVVRVLQENTKAVRDYKNGKTEVIGFLIGKTTQKIGRKIDPQAIRHTLEHLLKK